MERDKYSHEENFTAIAADSNSWKTYVDYVLVLEVGVGKNNICC